MQILTRIMKHQPQTMEQQFQMVLFQRVFLLSGQCQRSYAKEQDYHIYIKATGDITSKDLEGDVTGTDSWYQTFSTDGSSSSSCDGYIPSVSDLFNDPITGVDCTMFDFGLQTVTSTTTETVVKVLVPGAEFMVKDVVNVKVKEPSGAIINEETLEITF